MGELYENNVGSINNAFDVESDINIAGEKSQRNEDQSTAQNDSPVLENNYKELNLLYGIEDTPPWYSCLLLGVQHYLVAIGGIIGLPLILAPALCIPDDEEGNVAKALIISSLFFTSGISTLIQSTIGIRLPILQGGTFSYLPPTFAILLLPRNQCPAPLPMNATDNNFTEYLDNDGTIVDGTELWQRRMREVQGAIAVASVLQVLLGITGLIGFLLRFIGPVTIAPAVALIGLDLFSVAYGNAEPQWGIAMFTSFVLILCSQYLKNLKLPLPTYSRSKGCRARHAPIFMMFPVLFALILGWLLSYIFTVTDVFPNDPQHPSYRARTDLRSEVIKNAPWFKFPYPGQWGLPVVTAAGVIGMFAGVIAGFVESIGDYYACARLSGAPNPPPHAINRGILAEGFGCILAGVIGTATATTSYSENIGAIGITRVGSRRVIQVAACVFILLGMLSKIGSVFVTIPDPVIGGLFCVMFGMISAVGISNLQYVDLNAPRNLFIVGFALFMGLTVPEWMKVNPGIIQTGSDEFNQILTVLLQTSMLVGGSLAFIFDNTIPGTEEERGILAWRRAKVGGIIESEESLRKRQEICYNLPFPTNCCSLSRYIPFLPEYGQKEKSNDQESTTAVNHEPEASTKF